MVKKDKFQSEVGEDGFYHIEVRPQQEFERFRIWRASRNCGIERVGGQRKNGVWNTVKWLISKKLAHIENETLIADDRKAQEVFDKLDSQPKRIQGDFFKAPAHTAEQSSEPV